MSKITKAETMRLLLNEMNKPIDREVLWDYMRMTPKQTGLPYDIFVDNGGEYKNNHHDLWLFVVDGDNLIPVTVSEHPIVKTLVHNSDISLEPVRVFIRNNHKRLKGLADGKAMMDLFFTGIKPYHSSLNESTERLDEMSKVYRHESGLPTVIWVDEDNYVFGNFPLDKAGEFNEYGAGKLLACVIKDGREFFIDTEGNEVIL